MPVGFMDHNLICPYCGNRIIISEAKGGYLPIWVKILLFRSLSNKRKITCSNCKETIIVKKRLYLKKTNKFVGGMKNV